jgi:hypothetical protein
MRTRQREAAIVTASSVASAQQKFQWMQRKNPGRLKTNKTPLPWKWHRVFVPPVDAVWRPRRE